MGSKPCSVLPVRGLAAPLAFAALFLASSGAPARAAEGAGLSGPEPIVVTARTLVADNRKQTVVYKGDVVVKKGDVTLYADSVVVRLAKEPGGGADPKAGSVFSGAGKVQTIEAEGGVKVVQKDKTATAARAVYEARGEAIVMTGSPRVWQGDNVLTGTKIIFSVTDDTISVEDARTILYQQEGAPGDGPGGE